MSHHAPPLPSAGAAALGTAPATISIIIPVYNERALVLELLERVRRADTTPYAKELIVVDDGSTDETGEILARYSLHHAVRLVSHPENRGKAAAIRSALDVATGSLVLIQDADLEYRPEEYPLLLAPFALPEVPVVYGSRFLQRGWPEKMRPANWLANRFFTSLVNLLYRGRITDEGTCYKVLRTELMRSLQLESTGFDFCAEVTAKLLRRGVPITEVPISYCARNRKQGKKPRLADGFEVVAAILRYRWAAGIATGSDRTADGSAPRSEPGTGRIFPSPLPADRAEASSPAPEPGIP